MTATTVKLPWAFGSPAMQEQGGIMLHAWWDSIFPYTSSESSPNPEHPGAFPGFQRNMFDNAEEGEKNFPTDRPFNTVVLNTHGLIESTEAPWRFQEKSKDDEAVQNQPNGVTAYLEHYVQNYLENDTYVILILPERELMNAYASSSDIDIYINDDIAALDPKSPYPSGSTEFLAAVIAGALNLLGDRLIGWFLVDEPDIPWFLRHKFATPLNMASLRDLILAQEELYAAATSTEMWHRPCIITFSAYWYFWPDRAPNLPEKYVNFRGMDMAWFDRYPWRISKDYVPRQFADEANTTEANDPTAFESDPIATARILRDLVNRLNSGAMLGGPNYFPVVQWLQTHGSPLRSSSYLFAAHVEPEEPPTGWLTEVEEGEHAEILESRLRRSPTLDEARFEAWLSLFGGSEGLANFAQNKVSDFRILQVHTPVALETSYFRNLRIQAPDDSNGNITKNIILRQYYEYPPEVKADPLRYMRPLVRLYHFHNPPSASGAGEYWLIILNRANGKLEIELEMVHKTWEWHLQEYYCNEPVGAPIDINQYADTNKDAPGVQRKKGRPIRVPFELEAWRVRLFKAVQF